VGTTSRQSGKAAKSGRTALVTGASRGLGLETCRELAVAGYHVLLTSRGPSGGAAARQLATDGLPVEHRPLDVVDPASVAALAADLAGTPIDVLVNNAGISMKGFDAEVARRTLEVNFFGALRVTEALLPLVPDGGTIVMVSSGMGELAPLGPALRERFTRPGLTRDELCGLMQSFVREVEAGRHDELGWPSSAYRVSKIGLNALVRILAPELAARHIRVNAVCPGWVRTDMGGPGASRSVEKGAASIVWAATLEDDTTGGFFRDGRAIPW
jgi:NAD(P)-dependent dehydrogenase (short-subunit alcohol dehydrogenase family)